jgi:hypothetical protein
MIYMLKKIILSLLPLSNFVDMFDFYNVYWSFYVLIAPFFLKITVVKDF